MNSISSIDRSRRSFLKSNVAGIIAGGSAASLTAQSPATEALKPLQACIFIMHYGGPSHLDTWDMKPNAPAEVRSLYQTISTSIPGRFVCEHLPQMAKLAHKIAVIRSMNHTMTNHNAAMYEALIGRVPLGGDKELLGIDRSTDFPSIGSVLTYLAESNLLPSTNSASVPLTNVALPHLMRNVVDLAGQNAGFLGGRYDPLQLTVDPNHPSFHCRELTMAPAMSEARWKQRKELLHQLVTPLGPGVEQYRQRAFNLLVHEKVQQAFELTSEPAATRDRYGRNELGQSLLLARRLVEAGVRFINVNDRQVNGQDVNWDSHERIFPRHRELLPPVDMGLSALIEDLESRGLLDSTLIVSIGEFGRTPKINGNAGRDHWPNCYHAVLAGGGVHAGSTYGESDGVGAYPADNPVSPSDLAATLFWRFGLDLNHQIRDQLGRPFHLSDGRPITELFEVG
ncbi:MAG: DUF1501 domain-containing protein [Pirellulales bacterium]